MKIQHLLYKAVLNGVDSQENCDGPDYDLMVTAADYIQDLEDHIMYLIQEITELNLKMADYEKERSRNLL